MSASEIRLVHFALPESPVILIDLNRSASLKTLYQNFSPRFSFRWCFDGSSCSLHWSPVNHHPYRPSTAHWVISKAISSTNISRHPRIWMPSTRSFFNRMESTRAQLYIKQWLMRIYSNCMPEIKYVADLESARNWANQSDGSCCLSSL